MYAEFENIQENLDDYIDGFIVWYQEYGGPALDRDITRRQVILTAMDSLMLSVSAVLNYLKMYPKAEWHTIKHCHDRRKETDLTNMLQVMKNGLRTIEEFDGAQV